MGVGVRAGAVYIADIKTWVLVDRIRPAALINCVQGRAMLTDASLRDLLRSGYEASDADFVAHPQEHMSRTVYFMTQFLAERQYLYISSVELQRRIDDRFRTTTVRPAKGFNPVDWFSAQWTLSEKGDAAPYFDDRYRELLDREVEIPLITG